MTLREADAVSSVLPAGISKHSHAANSENARIFVSAASSQLSPTRAPQADDARPSRRAADRVHALPGLTFAPNFDMYAGYLHAGTGNHLFYLFVALSTS